MARILAERVDPSGSVLAVDLDTTLLERPADERIEVSSATVDVRSRPPSKFLVHLPFTVVTLSPTNPIWERTWSAFLDAIVAGDWDPQYDTRTAPGGSAPLLAMTIERMRAQMITLGADPGEIDEAQRLFADPVNTITVPTVCAARGRRPR